MTFVRALVVAFALLLALPVARPAFAGFVWCEAEPHVTVQVAGRTLGVDVWIGVPLEQRADLGGLSLNQQQVAAAVVDVQAGEEGTAATIRVTATVRSATGRPFPVRLRLAVPAVDAASDSVYGTNDAPLAHEIRVLVPRQTDRADGGERHDRNRGEAQHGQSDHR